MTDYVIIVAGGKGLRMGGEVPKQFLPVGGIPVLMRTLMRFREYSADLKIILVLPKSQQDYWRSLCQQHQFPTPLSLPEGDAAASLQEGTSGAFSYLLADGGRTRFHSVLNGLALIPDDAKGVVGVHDGVRPFVSVEVIGRCYDAARSRHAVIPVVPVVETLRHVEQGNVFRDDYRLVQTPQVFDRALITAALADAIKGNAEITDDCSAVERIGAAVHITEGSYCNIKITTPEDIVFGGAISSMEE